MGGVSRPCLKTVVGSSLFVGCYWPARRQVLHPQVVSACAGAEMLTTPMLSTAVTTARPTLRVFFILEFLPVGALITRKPL